MGALLPASTLMSGCALTKHYSIPLVDGKIDIPLSHFTDAKGKQIDSIIVQNEQLKHPIFIHRLEGNQFNALWMQCPHQGAELQAFGDKLVCPAHGSEFDIHGKVLSPPANENLRQFKTITNSSSLTIQLS